jgi:threonyl-tRNA synthetase
MEEFIHKIAGRKLELFIFMPGFVGPVMLERGLKIFSLLNKLLYDMRNPNSSATTINTPQIVDLQIFEKSGHASKYINDLWFLTGQDHEPTNKLLKPMSCPAHISYMKSIIYSANQLPLTIYEDGRVCRKEAPGAIRGMFRQYSFTQDDGHIACTEEQIYAESEGLLRSMIACYTKLGIKITFELSGMPEQHIGDISSWQRATSILKEVLVNNQCDFIESNGGAFYGPKIDLFVDALQCGTIQLDFFSAKNLGFSIESHSGHHIYPIIIHRAVIGSYERFLAVILEKYAGKFLPHAINPCQLAILFLTQPAKEDRDYIITKLSKITVSGEIAVIDVIDGINGLRSGIKKYKEWAASNIAVIGEKELISREVILETLAHNGVYCPTKIKL